DLLRMCSGQLARDGIEALDHDYWTHRIARAAAEGDRVLGFSAKIVSSDTSRRAFDDLKEALVFLAVVGITDPPREEAVAAIADCRSAGIAVKMITGDHGATAAAIARQLGLDDDPKVLTGRELDSLSDTEIGSLVNEVSVFARTSPEHK